MMNILSAKGLREALAKEGYAVDVAHDGHEAHPWGDLGHGVGRPRAHVLGEAVPRSVACECPDPAAGLPRVGVRTQQGHPASRHQGRKRHVG